MSSAVSVLYCRRKICDRYATLNRKKNSPLSYSCSVQLCPPSKKKQWFQPKSKNGYNTCLEWKIGSNDRELKVGGTYH